MKISLVLLPKLVAARGGSPKQSVCLHILVLLHVGLLAHTDMLDLLGAEYQHGYVVWLPLFVPLRGVYTPYSHDVRVHLGWYPSGAVLVLSASMRNATWLILPVVICLSQRLSHACVSMN